MFFTVTAIAGCSNILEGSVVSVSDHESTPYERPPAEQIIISDLDEMKQFLDELIMTHKEFTTVHYQGTDNESIGSEIDIIANQMLANNPYAAYAVEEFSITTTRIVAYVEVEIAIEFKRTAEQVDNILHASNRRSMMTQLVEIMSEYNEEAVFYTNLELGIEDIEDQVTELYYQNPRRIVMKPFVTMDVFPEVKDEEQNESEENFRIYEIKLGYTEDAEMLRSITGNLDLFVRQNAARADGETDGEILLSLVENLIAGSQYDAGTAETIAMYAPQNIAATAYGALVRGNAIGEGFAMAFKALCDELSYYDCRVVLGTMGDNRYHAWNIVALEGHYYHIDAAMCAVYGLEAGFLKTDADFSELYTWDLGSTPRCNGPLTLEDLLPPDDEENRDDDDDGGLNGADESAGTSGRDDPHPEETPAPGGTDTDTNSGNGGGEH